MHYQQFELDLPVGRVSALRNTTRANTRVLCLHGWLDNRASFLPMLPWLEDLECVAVDLIGHGHSSHRERGAFYHYIDYVRDIKFILDALQWPRCHLLGHSMGGSLSLMTCNAFPEQVQSLCMIDSLHPLTRAVEDGPSMLARAMQQISQWDDEREKIFPGLDAAVRARLAASPFRQSRESARLIMEHATERTSQGYRLLSDSRLQIRSPLMLSDAQLEPFIRAVEQPVLAILGSEGLISARSGQLDTTRLFRQIQVEIVTGGHHLHMDFPRETATRYLEFLSELT